MAQLPSPRAADPASAELVRQTMPLVGYIVTELLTRLPAHVRREDLESAGYEALVRCAKSYDPSVGTSFAQYARIRVRGAVVDELRSADWASRGTRRAERRITGAEDVLTQQLGRQPSAAELAEHLGEDGDDLVRTRERVQRAAVFSLNALVGDSDVDLATNLPSDELGQEDRIIADERAHVLRAAVEALPDRLRQVITDYFLGEKPMTEIAAELGVSESRISQMRAQALELLREGLSRHLDGVGPTAGPEPGVAARRREEYYARVAALSGVSGAVGAYERRGSFSSQHSTQHATQHASYVSALA
jgi:RNA polymerase sigma factor for flagellar operon FliA